MSTPPCPSELPPSYLPVAHLIAAVSAPINLLALYLVFFQSPGMSRYKYCIFYLQVVAFFAELKLTLISPGYFFFPILGGYQLNAFSGSFRRTHLLVTDFVFLFASELPAIYGCFVYRHTAAVEMVSRVQTKRPLKTLGLIATHIFPFAMTYGMYMSEISKEETLASLEKNYPQCIFWVQDERFVVYDYHINPWVAITGISALTLVVFFISCAFGLGFHTMIVLHRLRPHMSVQTYRIHRAALISLSLQVVIPAVLVILPLIVLYIVIFFDLIEYQTLATDMTLVMTCHSVCSSTVMIITNARHREFLVNLFLKGYGKIKRKGTVTVEPSVALQTVAAPVGQR